MPSPTPFLDAFLRRQIRRRRRVVLTTIVSLVLLAAFSAGSHLGCIPHRGGDWKHFDREDVNVVRVVDGDTLRVRDRSGRETAIRLIGIDAPEMRSPDDVGPQFFAREATDYAARRVAGQRVLVRLDGTRSRDRYDRLLAYVWISDTESLNHALVRDGYAYADRRFRHTYAALYEQTENEARKKRRGLWKDVTPAQMPAWRQKWLAERTGGG
jgi:micrococcal nuclease